MGAALFWWLIVAAPAAEDGDAAAVDLVLQVGHAAGIRSVSFSEAHDHVLTTGRDGQARVWERSTGRILFTAQTRKAALSPDGATLAVANADGSAVVLIDVATTRELRVIGDLAPQIHTLEWLPDGRSLMASSTGDRRVMIWDAYTGRVLEEMIHGGRVYRARVSPDGRSVLTSSVPPLMIWRPETKGVRFLQQDQTGPHPKGAEDARWSPDGTKIVSWGGFDDRQIVLWDVTSGQVLWSRTYEDRVETAAWSPDSSVVAVALSGAPLQILDAGSGEIRHTLGETHSIAWSPEGATLAWAVSRGVVLWDPSTESQRRIRFDDLAFAFNELVEWSPDGRSVALARSDGDVHIWNVAEERFEPSLTGATAPIVDAEWSPDATRIAVASAGLPPAVWDLRTGRPRSFSGHDKDVTSVAWSHDGTRFVTTQFGGARVFHSDTGRLERRLEGSRRAVTGAAWSPDDASILTRSDDGTAIVWDAATGTQRSTLTGHSLPLTEAVWSPDGTHVATASMDGTAAIFVAETGARSISLEGVHEGLIAGFQWSPDGDRVATWGEHAAIWDARTGRPLHRVERQVNRYAIGHIAWSPDGRRLITVRWDGVVVRDARSFGPLAELGGADLARWSPDGTRILTATLEHQAVVWDAYTGLELVRVAAHTGKIAQVAWSADGQRFLTASTDGTLHIADGRTGATLATLVLLADGTWVATDREGRFDTDDAGTLHGAAWRRGFDPLRSLPLTTFAREYYVPGLLRDAFSGADRPAVPDITATNVLTPTLSIDARAVRDSLRVAVTVCARTEDLPMREGPRTLASGAQDLKVFVQGRLAFEVPGALTRRRPCRTHEGTVDVPAGTATVEVSAHAFNDDQVKSDTALLRIANPRSDTTPDPQAYLVHVGVDDYRDLPPLSWAGADAHALSDALASIPGHEVHRVVLAKDGAAAPTREHLQAILSAIAGRGPVPPWAPGFAAARPDDVVMVTFSGHGYAPEAGAFHLMLPRGEPRRRRPPKGTDEGPNLVDAVSETTLSAWLRPIRAGELVLVVDACQSAASVEGEGFKPGPLGSPGFGQLAYDKGMLVLVASQKDDVALESPQLRRGLLTWALVEDGLGRRLADTDGRDGITLREWLTYAEERVPALSDAIAKGEPIARGNPVRCERGDCRGSGRVGSTSTGIAQRPRLFAFKGSGSLQIAGPSPEPTPR